jgi:DNA-binding NtrC family response regulator
MGRSDSRSQRVSRDLVVLRTDVRSSMQTIELAVVCSGMPGFIRSMGAVLTGRFRQFECYSISEAARITQMHEPEFLVVDLRNAPRTQCNRMWAILQNSSRCRSVAVVQAGSLTESSIPQEIASRVSVVEQSGDEDNLNEVATLVLAALTGNGPTKNEFGEGATREAEVSPDVMASTIQAEPTGPLLLDNDGAAHQQIAQRYRTKTPELRHMLERLQVAAQHDVTILLIGETGSGKTHLARLIHEESRRAAEPFVTVACGAIAGELIESELFGHAKGAFTSAHADKDGKFLAAGRGTILLDEIDVLTPEQQVKLLRIIETGQYERVGCNDTLSIKARIIAASNMELQPLVEQGRFRPDLYYRLNTLTFRVPPLRKRLPDIEPLARYFVQLHTSRHGIKQLEISESFLQSLVTYPWPGNVREMENAIRSAVIYSRDGVLTADTLPPHVINGMAGPGNDSSVRMLMGASPNSTLETRIELTEKDIIEQALLENSFSRTQTAKQLGISRVTLYNKMKKYDMMPKR